jgi:hypothetical protein
MPDANDQDLKRADNGDIFELGLTLAGAISAGAYTAGVIDFLFQALDEWEKHRGEPGVPSHRVAIQVITGASAGAITGALSAPALAHGLHPAATTPAELANCYPSYRAETQPYSVVLPSLFRTWVDLPDMIQSGTRTGLLGTIDLANGNTEVASLLDATVLDTIKTSALSASATPDPVQNPVPYIASPLHVYMTLSNMRGIPYSVGFGRTDNKYGMITHGDRAHYKIEGLGTAAPAKNPWLDADAKDAALTLNVANLPTATDTPPPSDWDAYGTSALASGAFPVGLAPRGLDFDWNNYMKRRLPIVLKDDVAVQPTFPAHTQIEEMTFGFQTVDGGLVNNNPFDYAQYALFGRAAEEGDRAPGRRAIIMVAPFPDPPKFLPRGTPSATLTAIVRALYPALLNQARFRISELAPAVDERDYSRYLIAPLRRIPRTEVPGEDDARPKQERFAIACGLLGGFGGFLHRDFRAHDFQLGRRNCQNFLRGAFTTPPGATLTGTPDKDGEVPIIPLLGTALPTVPLPRWPQLPAAGLGQLQDKIDHRLDRVVPALIDGQSRNRLLRGALKIGWFLFLRSRTRIYVRAALLSDLVRRRQIEGYAPPPSVIAAVSPVWHDTILAAGATNPSAQPGRVEDDTAAVMAELINPAYRFRTPSGIASGLGLPKAFVTATLNALANGAVPDQLRSWEGPFGWTTWGKRPGWLERQPKLQPLFKWWDDPVVS